ncbi:hypothetical protein [Jatrophihabitans sp. GAS493]|uniref:hypothetical protein n=1 Tax=Jatrophihabitans sp. GAS493 TaxID=1907575 RepID=UPI000BB95057|nr:hypothetical protein [Jatrophihabitans sp. GAS493]
MSPDPTTDDDAATAADAPATYHRADAAGAGVESESVKAERRELTATRAFQVYSERVTATARALQETPTEELHRKHEEAAHNRRGLEGGHTLR